MKFFCYCGLILLLLLLAPCVSYAQVVPSDTNVPAQLFISPIPTPTQKSAYVLPYPGILPDNPLYFLKASRDRIISFLIADPIKRAQFDLLEADKRLAAGISLFDETPKKEELTETTISKGENYFEEAISATKDAKQQHMDIKETKGKLSESIQKHKEVLVNMENQSSPAMKKQFQILMKRVDNLSKEVSALKP